MNTVCNTTKFTCQMPGGDRRRIEADFSGGTITSDAGILLVDQANRVTGMTDRLAQCFEDTRAQHLVVHDVATLVGQRVFGLALGYEDLNDHDTLRHDQALGATLGQLEPGRADCAPLASKSTLNRFELAAAGRSESKNRKVVADFEAMAELMVKFFIESYKVPPKEIVLDLDATDVPLYGDQEEKFFHGTYKEYCTMPLLVFCKRMPVMALLRSAARDVAAGIVPELDRLIQRIRVHWPDVHIILRTDSGFCREAVLAWAEGAGVDYVIGLPSNSRLKARIAMPLQRSRVRSMQTGAASRRFRSFRWRTLSSWSRSRRVVAKAEVLPGPGGGKANPRFIVTSLPASAHPGQRLYEDFYCARGDAENRVKEHKTDLFSKRCSTNLFDANALRFMLATFAMVLVEWIRRSLAGTRLARARPQTLRLRLFRIGARINISVRRVQIAMSSAFPDKELFGKSWFALKNMA